MSPTLGECCSSSGYCGSTPGHCEAGCQEIFDTCRSSSGNVTTNGQCGFNGKTCKGSGFGDCCSSSGFYGSTTGHCEAGCQVTFGTCSGTGTGDITTDGKCGGNGKICEGSEFGNCCSSSGFCGNASDFCGAGCQSGFGNCTGTGNISTDGTPYIFEERKNVQRLGIGRLLLVKQLLRKRDRPLRSRMSILIWNLHRGR